jgi:hypothetical protein
VQSIPFNIRRGRFETGSQTKRPGHHIEPCDTSYCLWGNVVWGNVEQVSNPCRLFPRGMIVVRMSSEGLAAAPSWRATLSRCHMRYVTPGCRAPIPSKGKQQVGAVFCRIRSIETQTAGIAKCLHQTARTHEGPGGPGVQWSCPYRDRGGSADPVQR